MKKSIIMGLLMLISITVLSGTNTKKDKEHFNLEGRFIAEKHVNYEIFEVEKDASLVLKSTGTGLKTYAFQVNVGKTYLVKFTTDKGQVKYLNLNVLRYGSFIVDIDFRNDQSAHLTYGGWYYTLKPIEDGLCYERKNN